MRKLFILICLVTLLSYTVKAQTNGAAPATINSPSSVKDETKKETPKPGIEIPPEKKVPINVPKIGVPINVDGKPDEDVWKTAAVFKDFYQTAPGNNVAPSKPTEAYMLYDEYNLYIAFRCWDEKGKVNATIAKRDSVFNEDNVRVWLDTYNDQRRAYVLGFNPYGVQQDGIYTEGQGADFSVDILMESKGVVEDWGWSVEVKIPFKSLRYAAGKGKLWGFNAARNIDRFNDEFDQWLPDDRNISGFLVKHGKISGLDDIKFERTLEVVPSITLGQTSHRAKVFGLNPQTGRLGLLGERFVNDPIKQDIGVTLKYTITPNITLDAAYNPDFAEIEADAPVVTANQRFPIFFQEKRPFFLEGADVFSTPIAIYYSRTIADPDLAAKLTGKIGKTSFGFLAAIDKYYGNYGEDDLNDPNRLPRISEFIDKKALTAVIRLKRDVGKDNSIGFFGSYRSFPEQKNLVASIDARFKLNPKTTSVFQVVGSNSKRCVLDRTFEADANPFQSQRNLEICATGLNFTSFALNQPFSLNTSGDPRYLNYRTGNGMAYYANIDHSTDQSGWFVEFLGRSKDFRSDAGFNRRTNINTAFFWHRNSTKSNPKGKIIRANWAKFAGLDYDWSGRLQGFNTGSNINLTLPHTMFLFAEVGAFYEKIYEEEFGLKRTPSRPGTFSGPDFRATWQNYFSINLNQNLNKKFNYGFFLGAIRNSFDYFNFVFVPNLLDPTKSRDFQNPSPGLQLDAEVFGEYKPIEPLRFNFNYRKSRLTRNDDRVRSFDSDIVSLKTTYQFSRFVFARVRIDYRADDRNYAGQALFGWNPSPGTAFYVGYNDSFQYNGFSPITGQFEPHLGRNSRTFFIRASYLFRKSF
jgi:hypothetical protein